MKNFEPIYQLPWDEIGMSIIGFLLLVALIWAVYQHDKEKEEFEATKAMFLPKQPEADQKRYNEFLDSIESHTPEKHTITMDEYRKAKETVWQFEKQESC